MGIELMSINMYTNTYKDNNVNLMTFHVVVCCSKRHAVECRYNAVQYNMHDIEHINAVSGAEYDCKFEPTK